MLLPLLLLLALPGGLSIPSRCVNSLVPLLLLLLQPPPPLTSNWQSRMTSSNCDSCVFKLCGTVSQMHFSHEGVVELKACSRMKRRKVLLL